MATNGSLTTRQRKAIAALLASRNVQEAAHVAKVGERTLYRWLTDPIFRAALLAAEGEAIDQATRRLIGLQDAAVDTLECVLAEENTSPAVRLRAAQGVLDYLLKLRDLRNVEERLAGLEAAVYGKSN